MPRFTVIIPAAGSSTRFGGPRNKLLEPLAGQLVLARTVNAFLIREDVAQIILPTNLPNLLQQLPQDPRIVFCPGGQTRAYSVQNALLASSPSIEWIAVHDGARPLVSQPLIDRTLQAAIEHGAAVPALPVALTIKQATGPLPARVELTVPRQKLWAMQTPQIARRQDLLNAFQSCPLPLEEVTDDMQLIELASQPVWLVEGEEQNLKITTPIDLKIAEMYLSAVRD